MLPRAVFLEQAHREKARALRTHGPLSIVTISIDGNDNESAASLFELSRSIVAQLRDTDSLGWCSQSSLAALLVDTDEAGARRCVRKILDATGERAFRYSIYTYPQHTFELLLAGCDHRTQAPFLDLLEESHLPRFGAGAKRTIDILGALFGLILLSPILFITAIAVKLSSKGPVIFRQVRLGRGGRSFLFYKFRSMRIDVDDEIHRAYVKKLIEGGADLNQGNAGKPLYKMRQDPRITRVGRFIRKTSIDELPQLYNVLRGDMSLIGPRPPLPYEVEHYSVWHLRRILDVQPGITGLWQVEGRSETTFDEMVRLDLEYLRNWSLGLDLKILLKTVGVVLTCRGSV